MVGSLRSAICLLVVGDCTHRAAGRGPLGSRSSLDGDSMTTAEPWWARVQQPHVARRTNRANTVRQLRTSPTKLPNLVHRAARGATIRRASGKPNRSEPSTDPISPPKGQLRSDECGVGSGFILQFPYIRLRIENGAAPDVGPPSAPVRVRSDHPDHPMDTFGHPGWTK